MGARSSMLSEGDMGLDIDVLFYSSEIILLLSYLATRMVLLRGFACVSDVSYIFAPSTWDSTLPG